MSQEIKRNTINDQAASANATTSDTQNRGGAETSDFTQIPVTDSSSEVAHTAAAASKVTTRSSNLELLRIVTMLLITAYHGYAHCIRDQLCDYATILANGNGFYNEPRFFWRLCNFALIAPTGQAGNAIFLLISGYFLANKVSFDIGKSAKKLLLQVCFAAGVLGTASIIIFNTVEGFSIPLISFTTVNGMCWYVGYYFLVIALARLFLNKVLQKLSKRDYAMLLLALFALLQFSWSRLMMNYLCSEADSLVAGIFSYACGGYIKKYNPFEKIKTWAVLLIIAAVNIVVIGVFYLSTAETIRAFDPNGEAPFLQNVPGWGNFHMIPLILGIAMFELFRRLKMKNIKLINSLAAATFMVYLIQDNEYFYAIWKKQDWITLLYSHPFRYVATYALWTLLVFGLGVLCYALYVLVWKAFCAIKPVFIKKNVA